MADSDWAPLEGDAARNQEADLVDGDLPPVGGKQWIVVETFDPPAPPTFTFTDEITALIEELTGVTEEESAADSWECTRTMTYYLRKGSALSTSGRRETRRRSPLLGESLS